jgi:rifampin ADP-ribosylating transferase
LTTAFARPRSEPFEHCLVFREINRVPRFGTKRTVRTSANGVGAAERAPCLRSRHLRRAHAKGLELSLGTLHMVSGEREPVPFEVYEPGVYLHGTKANLAVGEMLVSGRESNFEEGRVMNFVYFTATLDAATWGAELASGEGRGRIYVVEPMGEFEDDPNVTNKRFPGNPTHSFRSREPVRVVDEVVDWVGHSPEKLAAMRDGLERIGPGQIED